MPVGGIVGKVGQIEKPMRPATALANVSGGCQCRQPELAPARIVVLSVFHSDWHYGSDGNFAYPKSIHGERTMEKGDEFTS